MYQIVSRHFEIGIAIAWQKPIYLLTKDLPDDAVPPHLQPFPRIAFKNMNKLAETIYGDRPA
jgi:hypothetical protein